MIIIKKCLIYPFNKKYRKSKICQYCKVIVLLFSESSFIIVLYKYLYLEILHQLSSYQSLLHTLFIIFIISNNNLL